MKFGVLKDIKEGEYRVIATPAEVSMLKGDGHEVYIQRGAGLGAGFQDEDVYKRQSQPWTARCPTPWQTPLWATTYPRLCTATCRELPSRRWPPTTPSPMTALFTPSP